MSAFVVNYGVIDDVVALIEDSQLKDAIAAAVLDRWGDPSAGTPDGLSRAQPELGVALLRMNIDAVCQRYETDPLEDQAYATAYQRQAPHPGKKQQGTSLACFTYQCAEGDVLDTQAHALLCELEGTLGNWNDTYVKWNRERDEGEE